MPNPCACAQTVSFDASASSPRPAGPVDPGTSGTSTTWAAASTSDATGLTASHAYPLFGSYTAALRVTDNNMPPKTDLALCGGREPGKLRPLAVAGGPYWIDGGQDLTLDGTGSSDPDAACGDRIVSYDWELNNDGTYDYSGATAVVPWSAVQSLPQPGVREPDRLRVTDTFGVGHQANTELTIFVNEPVAGFTAGPIRAAGTRRSASTPAVRATAGRTGRSRGTSGTSTTWRGSFRRGRHGGDDIHAYPLFGSYTAALRVTDNNIPPQDRPDTGYSL